MATHDFDYETWTPGTHVTLCSVPWGADYRDVVVFDSPTGLDDYINNGPFNQTTFTNLTYARVGEPVKVPLPFNIAYRYNYLRVYNPAQPGEGQGKTFYYFIHDVKHIAPNTTQLLIQLDVFQTFYPYMSFGNCFVERGHVGIAERDSFHNYGRTFLTQPEGFDLGGEYQIDRVYRKDYGDTELGSSVEKNVDVLVFSTTKLYGNVGTVDAPVLNTATGSTIGGLPNGVDVYFFDSAYDFSDYMGSASMCPWVTQGIISVMAIPTGIVDRNKLTSVTGTYNNVSVPLKVFGNGTVARRNDNVKLANDFRGDLASVRLNGRYRNLKKFLTYPYSFIEVTTYSGAPLVLKPESIGSGELSFIQMNHVTLPASRVTFSPRNYNKGHGQGSGIDDGAEFLDMQTGFYNFPTFSVVNNGYALTLASQANSIAYQYQSADWSQQRTATGNQLSFDQSSMSITTNSQLTEQANQQARAMTNLQNTTQVQHTGLSAATGIVGGAASGGLAGAGAGALNGAVRAGGALIDINARNQSTNLSTAQATRQMNTSNQLAGNVRDTNKAYADWANKGDYSNAIAGINARVQDARLTQPTTSGQIGGDAALLATHKWQLVAKTKMIQDSAMNAIGEYWLRYGYALNRFMRMPQTLHVMEKFTYWRVKELYVTAGSEAPEFARQTIRAIFEKGVTVWKNPRDIGMIDLADNNPVVGDYLV